VCLSIPACFPLYTTGNATNKTTGKTISLGGRGRYKESSEYFCSNATVWIFYECTVKMSLCTACIQIWRNIQITLSVMQCVCVSKKHHTMFIKKEMPKGTNRPVRSTRQCTIGGKDILLYRFLIFLF
jgi:hypothetical protein